MQRIKEVAARDLKDPSSAQFRDMRFVEGGKTICGEMNAKNSYGAYAGFRPFIAQLAQSPHPLVLTPENDDLTRAEGVMCARAILLGDATGFPRERCLSMTPGFWSTYTKACE